MSDVNQLTEEQKQFLEECVTEFSNRYTEDDEEYKKAYNRKTPPPPIVPNWTGRPSLQAQRRGTSRQNNLGEQDQQFQIGYNPVYRSRYRYGNKTLRSQYVPNCSISGLTHGRPQLYNTGYGPRLLYDTRFRAARGRYNIGSRTEYRGRYFRPYTPFREMHYQPNTQVRATNTYQYTRARRNTFRSVTQVTGTNEQVKEANIRLNTQIKEGTRSDSQTTELDSSLKTKIDFLTSVQNKETNNPIQTQIRETEIPFHTETRNMDVYAKAQIQDPGIVHENIGNSTQNRSEDNENDMPPTKIRVISSQN